MMSKNKATYSTNVQHYFYLLLFDYPICRDLVWTIMVDIRWTYTSSMTKVVCVDT